MAMVHRNAMQTSNASALLLAAADHRRNGPKWGDVEFPLPFGRTLTGAEQFVASLDEKTGESDADGCWGYGSGVTPPQRCRNFTPVNFTPRFLAGASLKFTVLNPRGRVWLMVAGGGASVIYADTVGDLGYAQVRAGGGRTDAIVVADSVV
jgi:ATP citrate (pro-S)-lyase